MRFLQLPYEHIYSHIFEFQFQQLFILNEQNIIIAIGDYSSCSSCLFYYMLQSKLFWRILADQNKVTYIKFLFVPQFFFTKIWYFISKATQNIMLQMKLKILSYDVTSAQYYENVASLN